MKITARIQVARSKRYMLQRLKACSRFHAFNSPDELMKYFLPKSRESSCFNLNFYFERGTALFVLLALFAIIIRFLETLVNGHKQTKPTRIIGANGKLQSTESTLTLTLTHRSSHRSNYEPPADILSNFLCHPSGS